MVQKYDKLVRDKIPEVIKDLTPKGVHVIITTSKLTRDSDKIVYLVEKLNEEAQELKESLLKSDKDSVLEEVVDVFAVLTSLIGVLDNVFGEIDIAKLHLEKVDYAGRFDDFIVLEKVEYVKDNRG